MRRRLPPHSRSISDVQSGTEPNTSAARPDGTRLRPSAATPIPVKSSGTAESATARHSASVGAGAPRARSTANRTPPAIANRTPFICSGAKPVRATRCAR